MHLEEYRGEIYINGTDVKVSSARAVGVGSTSPPSLHIYLIFTSKHTTEHLAFSPFTGSGESGVDDHQTNEKSSAQKTGFSQEELPYIPDDPYTAIWLTRHRLSCSL